jgi:hypothetical protein
MVSRFYLNAEDKMKDGSIDWVNDTVKAMFVNTQIYNFDAAHSALSDISLSARVGKAASLTNKRFVFDAAAADDLYFEYLIGAMVGSLVLYKDNGEDDTSDLIVYIGNCFGMPFLPNGGDVTITWDRGLKKIFTLYDMPATTRSCV